MTFAVHNLAKSFGPLHVLEQIDFSFRESSIVAILGPSGCGKTTMLNLMSGIIAPDTGELEGFSNKRFSYCFQEPRLLDWLTAEQNMRYALSSLLDKETTRSAALARIDRFLGEAGLKEFASYLPRELSGGMQKRLSLARAFASPADILLLDEAFSAVDLKQRIDLMETFIGLWTDERPTTIMVTHDIHDALYLAHLIVVLSQRPSRVIGTIAIDIPHKERTFASTTMAHYEMELYKLLGFSHSSA